MGVYPTRDLVHTHGREHTQEYRWGNKYGGSPFCTTCGVNVFANVYGPPQSVLDAIPPARKERAMALYHKNMNLQPLNVRALDGINLGELDVAKHNTGTEGYEPQA